MLYINVHLTVRNLQHNVCPMLKIQTIDFVYFVGDLFQNDKPQNFFSGMNYYVKYGYIFERDTFIYWTIL